MVWLFRRTASRSVRSARTDTMAKDACAAVNLYAAERVESVEQIGELLDGGFRIPRDPYLVASL